MLFNTAHARALKWAVVCAHFFAGTIAATAQVRSARPEAIARAAATAQPLQFFTINDRLAALRAVGRIADTVQVPSLREIGLRAAASAHEPPSAISVGLRLTMPEPEPETLLNAIPFAVPGGDLDSKWRGAMKRWTRDESIIAACEGHACAHPGARRWLEIRKDAEGRTGRDVLVLVNDTVNASIRYQTDHATFGAPDYWASPLEVMSKAGDCEDYAIAKFLMLRSLGFSGSDMRVVALKEKLSGEFHAVLAVRAEGEWVFLDNKVTGLVTEAHYADATPLATVGENGQSMLVRYAKKPPVMRLSRL